MIGQVCVVAVIVAVFFSFRGINNVVEIPGGKIRGEINDKFFAFKAIPYAEPPVGKNKLESPKSFKSKWQGIRDGTTFSEHCMQWHEADDGSGHLRGSEDCLYLNVYTPSIEGNELHPVIVVIHGGSFMFGTGNDQSPERIMKSGKTVVVTINYRLGPLGFLSTEDKEIPGNMGLKDQNLAIQWVKKNIHIFKGNSEKITLTGFSAGGASVHYHMLSPKSRGLFNLAVSHSGVSFCAWASVRNSLQRTKKLAAHIGCPTDNTKSLKKCLQQKDAKKIVSTVPIFQPFMSNPFTVFGPTVEPPDASDAFLTEDMETIIKNGKSAKVPWIIAFATDEGGYNAAYLLKRDSRGRSEIDSLGDIWPNVAASILFYNDTVPADRHAQVAEELKRRYLKDDEFSVETYRKTQTMFSEQQYLLGIEKAIRLHISYSNAPVYMYRFNRPLANGLGKAMAQRDDVDLGTVHGDDFYLLFTPPFIQPSSYTEDDDQVSKKLINLYDTFIKTGVPKYGDIDLPANRDANIMNILQINGLDDYKVVQTHSIIETH